MGKDYDVRELVDGAGSGRFEVTAILTHSDAYSLRLGQALIETGAIKYAGFLFRNIGNKPHVIFKVLMGTNYEIYPRIAQAQELFNAAVVNASKLRRVVKAIEIAEAQTSKEQGSK